MAIFFARYEASQFGSRVIDTEHLLLGILRVDQSDTAILHTALGSVPRIDKTGHQNEPPFLTSETASVLRKRVEAHMTRADRISTSIDLPLTRTSKHVLTRAYEIHQQNDDLDVSPLHLLWAISEQSGSDAAEALKETGITAEAIGRALGGAEPHPN